MTNVLIRRIALTGVLLVGMSQLPALAQGPGNGGPQPGATTAPIDGGASLLLAGGVALALRRLRRK
ncbi:PID-CTERM protein-sorting domain-containing protein [Hymenobacter cellulosilyticus]|uniref:VPDSG-CTERM sorting domain-containing protein n=1 Tax=Hymenobacter cellulosilyticus TaxID=2932248 RepID=A0A8T9Q8P5_9BACT|nr:hypothetical protein [Hymenobacter cellulosilyticus]UOQ72781.1 hypothetical protein MUN79_01960 [Hymenobacter cellulosilyticus]